MSELWTASTPRLFDAVYTADIAIIVPSQTSVAPNGYGIAKLSDGSWLQIHGTSRNDGEPGELWWRKSYDEGVTWTTDVLMPGFRNCYFDFMLNGVVNGQDRVVFGAPTRAVDPGLWVCDNPLSSTPTFYRYGTSSPFLPDGALPWPNHRGCQTPDGMFHWYAAAVSEVPDEESGGLIMAGTGYIMSSSNLLDWSVSTTVGSGTSGLTNGVVSGPGVPTEGSVAYGDGALMCVIRMDYQTAPKFYSWPVVNGSPVWSQQKGSGYYTLPQAFAGRSAGTGVGSVWPTCNYGGGKFVTLLCDRRVYTNPIEGGTFVVAAKPPEVLASPGAQTPVAFIPWVEKLTSGWSDGPRGNGDIVQKSDGSWFIAYEDGPKYADVIVTPPLAFDLAGEFYEATPAAAGHGGDDVGGVGTATAVGAASDAAGSGGDLAGGYGTATDTEGAGGQGGDAVGAQGGASSVDAPGVVLLTMAFDLAGEFIAPGKAYHVLDGAGHKGATIRDVPVSYNVGD